MIKLPEGDHPLTIALCDHQRGEGHRGWWPCSLDRQAANTQIELTLPEQHDNVRGAGYFH